MYTINFIEKKNCLYCFFKQYLLSARALYITLQGPLSKVLIAAALENSTHILCYILIGPSKPLRLLKPNFVLHRPGELKIQIFGLCTLFY